MTAEGSIGHLSDVGILLRQRLLELTFGLVFLCLFRLAELARLVDVGATVVESRSIRGLPQQLDGLVPLDVSGEVRACVPLARHEGVFVAEDGCPGGSIIAFEVDAAVSGLLEDLVKHVTRQPLSRRQQLVLPQHPPLAAWCDGHVLEGVANLALFTCGFPRPLATNLSNGGSLSFLADWERSWRLAIVKYSFIL